jgi:predicted DNA-binding protein with PD1-like motif
MHCKRIDHNPKTFALIMDTGDEVVEILKKFASSQQLSGAASKPLGRSPTCSSDGSIGKRGNTK